VIETEELFSFGVMPGDGTGPVLMEHALRVARELVKDEVASGRIEFRTIEGMTIENRVAKMQSLRCLK